MLASHHANTTAVKTFQEYKASSETAALPLSSTGKTHRCI